MTDVHGRPVTPSEAAAIVQRQVEERDAARRKEAEEEARRNACWECEELREENATRSTTSKHNATKRSISATSAGKLCNASQKPTTSNGSVRSKAK
jgi:hypothetical protein